MMVNMANLMAPFMNDTAKKIKEILKLEASGLSWKEEIIKGDLKLESVPLLFQKIDNK